MKDNEKDPVENISQDDVTFEEVNDDGEVDVKDTVKKLREKIKKLEAEKQEYLDLSQRTRADYANFKKEVENARATDRKYATRKFIEQLLPVLDGYDMARGNKEAWEKVDANWRMGIEYIFGQMKSVLEGEGITRYGSVGELFNPEIHESMELTPTVTESEHDRITRVLQEGYRMHDTILRPAKVHVGRYERNEG
jgi:molecular chaperone GrpE